MKKIISLMLVVIMVLSLATTALATSEKQVIHVSGKVEDASKTIKISLKYGNTAMYMNQFKVEENGEYNITFEHSGIKDLVLQVTQSGEDVTNTVTSAYAESKNIVCDADVTDSVISAEKTAEIKELYDGVSDDCLIAVVSYDKNNKLQNVVVNNKKTENGLDIFAEDYKAPSDTAKIKVFMLGSGKVNIPLAGAKPQKTIKVLAIGNSYAVDAYAYLDDIAALEGVNLELRIAQQSGASFTKHWNTWSATTEDGRKKYTENGEKVDIAHFLEDGTEYDFITIQSSILNAKPGQYLDSAEHLVKYIRERQPKAEIVIHQTWSCEKGSPVEGFVKNYKGDRDAMTKQIEKDNELAIKVLATVETDSGLKVSLDGKPLRYIPSGNAVTIARQSEMFDTTFTGGASWDDVNKYLAPENTEESQGVISLHRDSYHMSQRFGRYLVALVWYRCLTGNSVLNNTYTNKSYPITEEARKIINAAAEKAVVDTGIWN